MKLVNSKYYEPKDEIMGGRITKDQIFMSLGVIASILKDVGIELEAPISECLLGSTGKKDTSGDIDLAVKAVGSSAFALMHHPLVLKTSRAGSVFSFVIKIPGCPELHEADLMNGFVQVDLIPGDLKWLKQFFYASERSAFKGAHRNLLISAYLFSFRVQTKRLGWSVWETETGPVFSQNHGVAQRHRKRLSDSKGKPYATKFEDTVSNQLFDMKEAACFYLGSDYGRAFDSVETLYEAIEDNYDPAFKRTVYSRFIQDYLPVHLNSDEFPWDRVPNIARCRE